MNPVLRRWLFFAGAAFLSAIALIWMRFFGGHAVAFLVVPISFVGALLLTRTVPSTGEGFSYGMMVSVLTLLISRGFTRMLQESETELLTAIGLVVFAMILAMIIGAGYGHFLGKDHPPIAELAILGAGAVIIPYLLYGALYFFGIDVYALHYDVIVIVWQLTIGYSFSRENNDDIINSAYLNNLIKHIGNKRKR